ncbi:MAG: ChaN family lipoprotein [Pseudomonadota bacterium]
MEALKTNKSRVSVAFLRCLLPMGLVATLWGCAAQPTLPPARIVLLGEVHDNPQGHNQRNALLRQWAEGGWRPAIVMEQFDREKQAALSQAQATCADAQCVIQAAGGKRWEWPYYEPIIELALRYRLPLVAGNVSRAEAAMVVKQGLSAVLSAETMEAFRLRGPLPLDVLEGQRRAIETGHCGKLPDTLAPGMVRAQIARDVWMAQMLLDNARPDAVLIAGNGHVRKDLGVPRWLFAAGPVHIQVHAYVEQGEADNAAAYDVTHKIAVHQRPDPCLAFSTPPTESLPSGPTPKE